MEPTQIEIKDLEHEIEWKQVQDLLERTPLSSAFPLAVCRPAPKDQSYVHLGGVGLNKIIKAKDEVIGYVHGHICERKIKVNSKHRVERVAYLGDMRIDPRFRRKGLSQSMGIELLNDLDKHSVTRAFGLIEAQNSPMLRAIEKSSYKSTILKSYRVKTKLILGRPKPPKKTKYFPIQPTEKAITEFCLRQENLLFAPLFSPSEFKRKISNEKNLIFFGSSEQGHDRILFALWDLRRLRTLKLIQMPPHIRCVYWLWNGVRWYTQAQPFPKVNEELRCAEICMVNTKEIDVKALDQAVSFNAWKMGCHMVNFVESGLGPEFPSIKLSGVCFKMDLSYMTVCGPEDQLADCSNNDSTLVDLAFV